MPEPQDQISPALERWLRITTRDLSEQARIDIQLEATRKYNAALEAMLAGGKERAVAETAALKKLGNPFDMGMAHERRYLTESDIEFLKNNLIWKGMSARDWLVFLLVIAIVFCVGVAIVGLESTTREIVLFLPIAALLGIQPWLARRLAIHSIRGRIIAMNLTFLVAIACFFLHSWLIALKPHDLTIIVAMFLLFLGRSLLILRKIGRKPLDYGKSLGQGSPANHS